MRAWPNDRTIAHLIFTDHLVVPTNDELRAALEHARRRGARAVRTSALFPRAAEAVADAGFEEIDRLALLKLGLDDRTDELIERPAGARTRPLRGWHHQHAAVVDQDAFGPLWGNDRSSLAEIRSATPDHHARWVRSGGHMAAFSIAGAAAGNGYLQRLAVLGSHRREGLATVLVIDAIAWMRRRDITTVLVNTGVSNDAALALYEGLGFVQMNEHLVIAEHRGIG